MYTSTRTRRPLAGNNYAVKDGEIRFFDATGRQAHDDTWIINTQMDPTSIDPVDPLPKIRQLIDDQSSDIDWSNVELVIPPQQGVYLFLAGLISPAHLRGAVEQPARVDIPNIAFTTTNGTTVTLTVRVFERSTNHALSLDGTVFDALRP